MDLAEDAHQDLCVAIQSDPNNEELRNELNRMEAMCNTSCGKEPIEKNGLVDVPSRNYTDAVDSIAFDP